MQVFAATGFATFQCCYYFLLYFTPVQQKTARGTGNHMGDMPGHLVFGRAG